MARLRLSAALGLLALAAGCRLFPTEPARSVGADVRVTTAGRGAADSIHVQASFFSFANGEVVTFRSDTLRVQNVIGRRDGGRQAPFVAQVPLDSATVANGLRVQLPVPTPGPVPHSEFILFSAARRGSREMTLRAGHDLVLPVVPGTSGTLAAPEFERWEVSFSRGGPAVSISATGPLPSPVLVPWALIPREGSETMQVRVFSYRQFRAEAGAGADNRMITMVSAEATLEWSVRILP